MEPIRAIISKRGYSVDAMKDAAKLASEELVDRFSVASTAENCIDKTKRIKELWNK
jgi:hypothetical protein